MSDYDIMIEFEDGSNPPASETSVADATVIDGIVDGEEPETTSPPTRPKLHLDIVKQILPKSLTMWLFTNNTKWYSIDSYKFGELTVTEDSLVEMIYNKDIAAFAYAIYRTHENDQGAWSDISDSLRIIFGVVELIPNIMHKWLRTRYLLINEIESPTVYKDSPPFVLQSLHRPRIWITVYTNKRCTECKGDLCRVNNGGESDRVCSTAADDEQCKLFCLNTDCEKFKMSPITLQCIDFESGPFNDLTMSIKTKSKHLIELNVMATEDQLNYPISVQFGDKKEQKSRNGPTSALANAFNGSNSSSSSAAASAAAAASTNVFNCIKCKNCKNCQRLMALKQTRCKRHPLCTHFMLKRRLM